MVLVILTQPDTTRQIVAAKTFFKNKSRPYSYEQIVMNVSEGSAVSHICDLVVSTN
jgi:hypothetical protein